MIKLFIFEEPTHTFPSSMQNGKRKELDKTEIYFKYSCLRKGDGNPSKMLLKFEYCFKYGFAFSKLNY